MCSCGEIQLEPLGDEQMEPFLEMNDIVILKDWVDSPSYTDSDSHEYHIGKHSCKYVLDTE